MATPETPDFEKLSVEESLQHLHVDPAAGLSEDEAHERFERYGANECPTKEETTLHRIFRRFWGPIPWMIEVAAILSGAVKKWEDVGIILVLLFVNAGMDFWQESKALNALAVLKEQLARSATVKRGGRFREIDARELVPGDIVKLKIGEIAPADVKLIEGDYLQVDQAALTGESLPVSKTRNDVLFANAIVKQGEMTGVVTCTGLDTYFGRTVALVAQAGREQHSHFQKIIIKIGNFLILVTVVMVALIILAGVYRHQNIVEVLRFSLVLTVAAIPVALPAVLTVTMAVGAISLAKRKAIVSRLAAIEEMAGMDVLCCDKTGTLTQNRMTVSDPVTFGGVTADELMLFAALASKEENRDPIEAPIFEYLKEHGLRDRFETYRQETFIPFDPVIKRTESVVVHGEERLRILKGAPQVLLGLCGDGVAAPEEVNAPVLSLAEQGYRTLGVAMKREGEEDFHYLGLIPLSDPPRDDARQTIEEAQGLGINVKMLTGDHVAIARQVAGLLGLEPNILESDVLVEQPCDEAEEFAAVAEVVGKALYEEFKDETPKREADAFAAAIAAHVRKEFSLRGLPHGAAKSHESQIIELIEQASGFAQVFPEEKYLIVDELQKAGHIVGMTGDGVNDAPALKKAEVGIAVSGATDAARAAADLVLLEPGISVIVHAVEQARIIFERMNSYAVYRIAETIRVILFMALAILVFNFYPITAIMIIVLALLNDVPILTIAYDNTKVNDEPVRWNNRELFGLSSGLGMAGVISSFLLFFLLEKYSGLPQTAIQSLIFLKMVVAGHGTIFNTRTTDWFFKKPRPASPLLWAAGVTAVIGTLLAVYGIFVPAVGWGWALLVWGYAAIWFLFNDCVKIVFYRNVIKENKLLGFAFRSQQYE